MNTDALAKWFNSVPSDMYSIHWDRLIKVVEGMVAAEREAIKQEVEDVAECLAGADAATVCREILNAIADRGTE